MAENHMGVTEAAVRASIKAAGSKITDMDEGACELAIAYAEVIDRDPDEQLWHVGPKLRDILRDLGLTPAARKAKKGGVVDDDASAGEDEAEAVLHQLRIVS